MSNIRLYVTPVYEACQQDINTDTWQDITFVAYSTLGEKEANIFLGDMLRSKENHDLFVAKNAQGEVLGLMHLCWRQTRSTPYMEISKLMVRNTREVQREHQREILVWLLQYLQAFPLTVHLVHVYPEELKDTVCRLLPKNRHGRGWLANTSQLHRKQCAGAQQGR